jgi:hypothetical protein
MSSILDRLSPQEIWIVGLTDEQLTGRMPFDPDDKINLMDLIEYIKQDISDDVESTQYEY